MSNLLVSPGVLMALIAAALLLSLIGNAVQVWLLVRAYELPHNSKAAQVILEHQENHTARVVRVEKELELLRQARDAKAAWEARELAALAELESRLKYLKEELTR